MAERQEHGFKFEHFCETNYGIDLSKKYGSKFDGEFNNLPVSIKCIEYNKEIEMADYFRNSETTEDFYLIVGFWSEDKSNIIETRFLKINGTEYHNLFDLSFNSRFKNLLNNITNDYSDDAIWKDSIKNLRKEWKDKTSNLIRPRFKRDHKNQKRIQCAINNKDFYSYFIPKYETGDFNIGNNEVVRTEG